MPIDMVLTCGKLFQLECHCWLVLVSSFGVQLKKTFCNCKNYFATIFNTFKYVNSQNVVENIVTKGAIFY
jgi:hypothetical protein